MKKQKRILPPSLTIYLIGGNKSLDKKLGALSKKHNIPLSTLGGLAIRAGLPQVEKGLADMLPGGAEQTPRL